MRDILDLCKSFGLDVSFSYDKYMDSLRVRVYDNVNEKAFGFAIPVNAIDANSESYIFDHIVKMLNESRMQLEYIAECVCEKEKKDD